MLITEYLEEHDLYMAIPFDRENGVSQQVEFVFANEAHQQEFIQAYFHNPYAATYAYFARLEGDREVEYA